MWAGLQQVWKIGKTVVLSAAVVAAGGSAAWVAHASAKRPDAQPAEPTRGERIARLDADRISVPAAVADRLKLTTAPVAPSHPSPLPPFQGTLALDNNTLQRVHARFAGEVVELGHCTVPSEGSLSTAPAFTAVTRPLQVGDPVKAGQLLAVVWSKDLGEKKSQLVDAVSKLKADEKVLGTLRDLLKQNATAERSVRDAERAVDADKVAVSVAERTLKAWRLTDVEIAAVRAEADRLSDPAAKGDPNEWARVEVRAARDGTILEKNLTVGDIVDTTADLFKIGDMTHLTVWVHVYEDDLPLLNALPKPIGWTVSLPSRPGMTFDGKLEQVGAVIDPYQHTALVSGRVDNPNGELKVGQFVNVRVNRPAHPGELVVPTEAVVEDGRQSVVFVRPDPAKGEFVRRPVTVARRTRDEIFLTADSQVRADDSVVTSGSLLLREAADALPAPPSR